MKPKLLVIPNDPLEAYDAKGYSRKERHNYFNPNSEFNVTILGFKDEKEKPFEYAGFKVYPINEKTNGLKKILEEVKPDLVRGYNGGWAAQLSGEIGKKLGIPSFTSVHDMDPTIEINKVNRTFCVSDTVKEKCLSIGIKEEKLMVLHDNIDMNLFKNYRGTKEVEYLNNKYSRKYKTLSVGRLVWEKNLENLLKASKIVKNELSDLVHIHIGEFGELKENINNLSKELKLNHFHLIPNKNQKELANFYSWADAFTMASVSEGFGIVYIEALACETPVVTSNIPPMNNLVFDRFNGLTANPHSPEDIAQKIIQLLTNKQLYQKIKSNTRKSVEKFDINKLKKQEAKFYKELL